MKLLFRHKLLFALLGLFIFTLLVSTYWWVFTPLSQNGVVKIVEIKRGMPLRRVSTLLEQEGIIRNKRLFVGMTTVFGKKGEIRAGEYELHSGMSPFQILEILVRGQVKRHLVTLVEGYTVLQIARVLEDSRIVRAEAFLEKASSPSFMSSLGLFPASEPAKIPTLEGYLFPDTYHLIKEMPPKEVIQIMVQRFKRVFTSDLEERISQLGISRREAIILASIIEKETSLPEEKPLVSAVLHNRLRRKIPLQSDPTVIYGIRNFDGNLRKDHLLKPTAYNTYVFSGLPPTPICNPGKDSILAALYPASVPHLYFVSRNDRSHHFSSTLGEHNQAVWKYQKQRSPRKP
jgi:UPF0755 protein